MALEGRIYGTTDNQYVLCVIDWTATQNIDGNYSTVTATLKYFRSNQGYTTYGKFNGGITINGNTDTASHYITVEYLSFTQALTYTVTVPHNSDGTKTITISGYGGIEGTSVGSTSCSKSITLDNIPRQATINAAPAFTDEENPTITYTNRAGTAVSSLQACISLNGDPDIAYRDISKTGSSYTFNLTTAERNILRQGTTGKSRTVKFYVKSVINGTTYYSSLAKTLTIANAAPTLNPTVIDSNPTTVALTGSNSRFIRYFSNAQYTVGAAALKYATLKEQGLEVGSKTSATASGTINGVESGSFNFYATDSRGYTTTKTVSKTMVNYIKLTCNLEPTAPNAAGEMTLRINGNYFNANFGAAANTLSLKWRYSVDGGDYTSWTAATPTISGNAYKFETNIEGLNYQSKYTFQAQVVDRLMTVTTGENSVKTTPVFDWSANDFAFNVPVAFHAGSTGTNKVLWTGEYYMQASQTINLTEPISQQMSGIALVFSAYADGAAQSYDWHTFFVPKAFVAMRDGTGHCFNMMSQAYGDVASKYLYISDESIAGHANNVNTGTQNGITYNNKAYVLRYVIGV